MNDPDAPRLRPWYIGLEVLDLEASVRFYRDVLGIPLEPLKPDSGDPWSLGSRYEALWEGGRYGLGLFAARPGGEARGVRVGFIVRNLDAAHARAVAAGADVLHPPRRMSWGRVARYRDPDGNIVGVSQFDNPIRPT